MARKRIVTVVHANYLGQIFSTPPVHAKGLPCRICESNNGEEPSSGINNPLIPRFGTDKVEP